MTMRKVALLGTPTSNGGKIVKASGGTRIGSTETATVDDLAHCPDCKGDFPIVALRMVTKRMANGKQVALEGDRVACHCPNQPVLLTSTGTLSVEG